MHRALSDTMTVRKQHDDSHQKGACVRTMHTRHYTCTYFQAPDKDLNAEQCQDVYYSASNNGRILGHHEWLGPIRELVGLS